jgi:pyridinium-3,5-biscarboxylic acid mononucleotide sulfurtransferase
MKENDPYQGAYKRLTDLLKKYHSAAVAFSGGTDSTLLLMAARDAMDKHVIAYTVKTTYIPDWELEEAIAFCKTHDISHTIIELPFPEAIRENPKDRCYQCKRNLFEVLLRQKTSDGMEVLIEGTNADDIDDYRPGLRALRELSVGSPLLEAGLTKADIRGISRYLGLPTYEKPAYACLLTRLPYDQRIAEEDLKRIESAELFFIKNGYRAVRIRNHDKSARIEIDQDRIQEFIVSGFFKQAAEYLTSIGFLFVSLDLEGYRKGSFNSIIQK